RGSTVAITCRRADVKPKEECRCREWPPRMGNGRQQMSAAGRFLLGALFAWASGKRHIFHREWHLYDDWTHAVPDQLRGGALPGVRPVEDGQLLRDDAAVAAPPAPRDARELVALTLGVHQRRYRGRLDVARLEGWVLQPQLDLHLAVALLLDR